MVAKLTTRVTQADRTAMRAAAGVLRDGGLVAFPTETVYGLGADAANGKAVARLYAAKGRPSFNPLIAHVSDADAAQRIGAFNAAAVKLAAAFWPGPLTLVVPQQPDCPVSALATAGLDTIALRVPDHPVAQGILAAFGGPIMAPSANRSGHVSPTSAAHVLADLRDRIDLIVNGGATKVGVESTIVVCIGAAPRLLRPGGLARADIEAVLGQMLATSEHSVSSEAGEKAPLAPGQLASHYAPRAGLRLDAIEVKSGEALLAFGPTPLPGADAARHTLNLSPRRDTIEAAANLFAHLRSLDALRPDTIAVMRIPADGLGEAINDRLRRAAAPKPVSTE
jgi:L-threonylcarbamoyladenylate synthase